MDEEDDKFISRDSNRNRDIIYEMESREGGLILAVNLN